MMSMTRMISVSYPAPAVAGKQAENDAEIERRG